MLIKHYQQTAMSVRVYPEQYNKIYPVLKLNGEVGELIEKCVCNLKDTEGIIKEMGDVLWYITAIAVDFDTELEYLLRGATTFDNYETIVLKEAPLSELFMTNKLLTDLSIISGAISEKVGKVLRDKEGKFEQEDKDFILEKLSVIGRRLAILSIKNHSHLSQVAETNIKKLLSRKERGVLTGSGDNR